MPSDKDLKRLIRARMQKTGEAYTAARAHIVTKPADLAAIAGRRDEIMLDKTGRTWAQWLEALDAAGAHALEHGVIARLVREQYGVSGWWAQTVTVGYERIRGLRETGQRRDGSYEVSRTRTIAAPVDVVFDAWHDDAVRAQWLTGADYVIRTAAKPRSMRLRWEDDTVVVVAFAQKSDVKCVVSVQHMKLPDRTAAERMKTFWSERLAALAALHQARPAAT